MKDEMFMIPSSAPKASRYLLIIVHNLPFVVIYYYLSLGRILFYHLLTSSLELQKLSFSLG